PFRRDRPASASIGILRRSTSGLSHERASRIDQRGNAMLTRSALTIRLHADDDVVIARSQLVGGTMLIDENVTVAGLVPPGHKIATRAIAKGAPVKRYNQIIGFASRPISPGEHVHLHNLVMGAFDRDYAIGVDAKPTQYIDPPATFDGIMRADG